MVSFVDLCGLAFVAVTLLATGGAHVARPGAFARLLRQHGLVPAALAAPLAGLVAGLEVTIGCAALAALVGDGRRLTAAVFVASLVTGGIFLVYLRRLLRSGHTGSCGCSPLTSPLTPASFVPAAFLTAVGAAGVLASWASAAAPSAPSSGSVSGLWSVLAVAWGVTLAAVALLLPASAPGRVVEAVP